MKEFANYRLLLLITTCAIILSTVFSGCSDGPTESLRPQLVVSEKTFTLGGAVDISGPTDQAVYITASNGGLMSYSAVIKSTGTRTNPWMRLLNETGFTPDTMVLRFSIGSSSEGTYVDTIIVTADEASNSPQMIEVSMTLHAVLTVSEDYIDIIALAGANLVDSQAVRIESNGSGPFDFTVEVNRSWLSVSEPQGTGPVTLQIYTDPAGLPQGIDTGRITISAPELFDSPKLVTIFLDVSAWAPQKAPLEQDLAGVYFLDENTGWAVGRIASISEVTGYIVRTTDAGQTWQLMSIVPQQPLGFVVFMSPTIGWIIGGKGLVQKTTDGGMTWTTQNTPAAQDNIDLWDGDFLDMNTGWGVGAKGVIVATTDGGAHWDYQQSGTEYALSEVSFVDAQHGWVVGNLGTILHTTDGGQNWSPQNSGTLTDLNGVLALNQNTVWVVGKSGTILYTTDGGTNWNVKPSPSQAILQTVFYADDQQGWITGDDGVILHTSDGGATWTKQRSGTGLWLRDAFFLDGNIGWVVGEQGVIMHTISGGN